MFKKMSARDRRRRLKALLKVYGYNCPFCNVDMVPNAPGVKKLYSDTMTMDHIVPGSKGGRNSLDNLVLCCYACNHKKANKMPSKKFLKIINDIRKKVA